MLEHLERNGTTKLKHGFVERKLTIHVAPTTASGHAPFSRKGRVPLKIAESSRISDRRRTFGRLKVRIEAEEKSYHHTVTTAPAGATDPAVVALVREANNHYARAQQAIQSADFETYGKEMRALQQALNQLMKLMGMGE